MRRFPGRVTLAYAQALANEGMSTEPWNPVSTSAQERTWTLRATTHDGRKAVCDEHGTVLRYTLAEAREAINTYKLNATPEAIAWRKQLLTRRTITAAEALFLKERHILRQYIVRQSTDRRTWVLTFNPGKHRKTLSQDHTRKPVRFYSERQAHAAAHLIGFRHANELAQTS